MKAAHDPLFDSAARRAFMASLRPLRYDVLASELEQLGLPRPSGASGMYRKLIRDTVATNPGDETTVAETVKRLFQPRLHLLTAPPQDADGYLDSLTAPPAPAACVAPRCALAACCATTPASGETCINVWVVCVAGWKVGGCSEPAGGDL
jgi:hypothetical protein